MPRINIAALTRAASPGAGGGTPPHSSRFARRIGSHACRVRLGVDAELLVEITDDGRGLPPALREGVGLGATRQIVRTSPHINVLVVTMFDDDHSVFSSMQAGARGYILKGASHAEMLRAIHSVGGGEAIFSPAIAVRLMDYFAGLRPTEPPQVFPELTEREREILRLIAQGYKNAEIASHLVLSPKTVRNHITNILNKLQVADRAEAILRARQAGLG